MNPLYQQMNGTNLLQTLNQFRQTIPGNPQQIVQNLLNSGKITQAQYNAAVQRAQELQRMLTNK